MLGLFQWTISPLYDAALGASPLRLRLSINCVIELVDFPFTEITVQGPLSPRMGTVPLHPFLRKAYVMPGFTIPAQSGLPP